jgi:hypothetical protein
MRVDEEGLQKLAQRFMKRKEIKEMGLTIDDVKRVLLEHARKIGGCVFFQHRITGSLAGHRGIVFLAYRNLIAR